MWTNSGNWSVSIHSVSQQCLLIFSERRAASLIIFLIFPRKCYLVRNSRWEGYICKSALNSADSSFSAFILLPSLIFGPQVRAFCRVAVSTLNTLAGYIDWVSLSYISSKYSEILEVLCLLLNEPELQLEAAECLVIAVRRKVSCIGLALFVPFMFISFPESCSFTCFLTYS